MTDDLVKRLRDACRGGDTCKCSLNEAADRIEALTAEVARLKTQCEGLAQAAMNNGQALILAEADLAAAVEALAAASGGRDWGFTMCECGMSGPCMADPCKHPFVANITGESHE